MDECIRHRITATGCNSSYTMLSTILQHNNTRGLRPEGHHRHVYSSGGSGAPPLWYTWSNYSAASLPGTLLTLSLALSCHFHPILCPSKLLFFFISSSLSFFCFVGVFLTSQRSKLLDDFNTAVLSTFSEGMKCSPS